MVFVLSIDKKCFSYWGKTSQEKKNAISMIVYFIKRMCAHDFWYQFYFLTFIFILFNELIKFNKYSGLSELFEELFAWTILLSEPSHHHSMTIKINAELEYDLFKKKTTLYSCNNYDIILSVSLCCCHCLCLSIAQRKRILWLKIKANKQTKCCVDSFIVAFIFVVVVVGVYAVVVIGIIEMCVFPLESKCVQT